MWGRILSIVVLLIAIGPAFLIALGRLFADILNRNRQTPTTEDRIAAHICDLMPYC